MSNPVVAPLPIAEDQPYQYVLEVEVVENIWISFEVRSGEILEFAGLVRH